MEETDEDCEKCKCTCAFDAALSLPKGPTILATSVRESVIAKVKKTMKGKKEGETEVGVYGK